MYIAFCRHTCYHTRLTHQINIKQISTNRSFFNSSTHKTLLMTSSKSSNYVPLNGGWGWIIVFGVSLINLCNQSMVSIFGLLFGDHLKSLGQRTFGAVLVANLNCLALNFSGVFIRPLMKQYSPRTVAAVGCLLTGVGLILNLFTTRLWQVCISYGLLVGTGLGLLNVSTYIVVNLYFTTLRGQAVGLAMAGIGVGQVIVPYMVIWLLEYYGFEGTVLIMGGFALNRLVGASMLQTVSKHLKKICENKLSPESLNTDHSKCTNDEKNTTSPKSMEIGILKSNSPIVQSTWITRISNVMD